MMLRRGSARTTEEELTLIASGLASRNVFPEWMKPPEAPSEIPPEAPPSKEEALLPPKPSILPLVALAVGALLLARGGRT